MIERISPLDMGLTPDRTIDRGGWQIPLTYVGERTRGDLFISDLSHVPKWCLQGPNLNDEEPTGLKMPQGPGAVTMDQGILLIRLMASEARIMALSDNVPVFGGTGFTNVTDAYASLAVVGPRCFDVLGKLSGVDLDGPAAPPAALAPVEDVTCLMVRLERQGGTPGIIISGARGYGHFLLDAFLDAGKEYGIQPAGLQRLSGWLGEP